MKTQKHTPTLPSTQSSDCSAPGVVENYYAYLRDQVIEHYRRKGAGSQSLLDVGVGSAEALIRLTRAPELAELQFIATSDSTTVANNVRRAVRAAGLAKRIQIVKDDIDGTQFKSDSYDLVISRFAMHRWKSPVRALKEIYRILKPGGVAILHDLRKDAPPEALARLHESGVSPGDPAVRFTPAEVESLIAKAGLRNVVKTFGQGPGASGFEIVIHKDPSRPKPSSRTVA